MFQNNKALSLAAIGIILGAAAGAIINSEQMDMYSIAAVSGVVGFFIGWVWQSRSDTPNR